MSYDGLSITDALLLFLTPTQSFVSSNVLLQSSRSTLYYVPEVNRFFSLSAYVIQKTVDIQGLLQFQLIIHTESIGHSTVSSASTRTPYRKHSTLNCLISFSSFFTQKTADTQLFL